MTNNNANTSKKITNFLLDNIVTIVFVLFVAFGFYAADGLAPSALINEVLMRFFRNGLLVLSLIIPVMAGLGLNFGIVVGALAGVNALILTRYFEMAGMGGLMLSFLVALPLALLFGYLTGKLYNKTRGQEMIAALIVSFFAEGVHLVFALFVIGGIIPVYANHRMIIPGGMGVRATFDMGQHPDLIRMPELETAGMRLAMDWLWRVNFLHAALFIAVATLIYLIVRRMLGKRNPSIAQMPTVVFFINCAVCVGFIAIAAFSLFVPGSAMGMELANVNPIPGVTALVILGFCLLTTYFTKTKLGQDCRSVGQSQHIAKVSGIDVDRTRIIATMISTVLAAWGMIIFLQEVGTVGTYTSHRMVGMFSVAAILVGGATTTKASVKNVIVGLILFHAMFVVSPAIGRYISNDEGVAEYLRTFMVYGVIGFSLGLYAWRTLKAARDKDALD
ncbi:MAG: ABC transporter permease [Defluviitaleaceae bacterium]|nr:ABC transporter permease [Defluviitaleaceae bacterium]